MYSSFYGIDVADFVIREMLVFNGIGVDIHPFFACECVVYLLLDYKVPFLIFA